MRLMLTSQQSDSLLLDVCNSRTPAPGYYNDDDVPDFMVRWQYGPGFPIYYHSVVSKK